MTLHERIVQEIEASGPMGFDRFMELALYDPDGGFFASSVLRSEKAGDFLTSPEVSAAFGATLAVHVEREYERLGRPADFTLIEAGAGSGSLLVPLLEALDFSPRVIAIEASPAARASLADRVPTAEIRHPDDPWDERITGVVLANELLDNLPMAIGVREADGWTERRVVNREGLALMETPARPDAVAWLDAYAGPVEPGGIVEVQLRAAAWLEHALDALHAGSIVLIDYGDLAELLSHRRAEGTIRTYRAHHLGPHPLDEPGATDITADVNFSALVGVAAARGVASEVHRQDDFLNALGLRQRLGELRQREFELARGDDTMQRLVVRNEVSEIETILHPRGLGDFRVFVATVGN